MMEPPAQSPWAYLHALGAHFILFTKEKKPKTNGWLKQSASLNDVITHTKKGHLVGIVPQSINYVCLDADTPGQGEAETLKALGAAFKTVGFAVPSRTEGRFHTYWAIEPNVSIGNKQWAIPNDGASGDVRCERGGIIIWHPEKMVNALKQHIDEEYPRLSQAALNKAIQGLAIKKAGGANNLGTQEDWADKNRNNTLFKLLKAAQDKGDNMMIAEVIAKAQEVGLSKKEIESTVKSATMPQGGMNKIKKNPSEAALETAFEHWGWKTQYNLLAHRIEVDKGDGGGFNKLEEVEIPSVLRRLREEFIVHGKITGGYQPFGLLPETFRQYLQALAYDNKIDPLKQWFEELPAWDGIPRIEKLFADHFNSEDNPLNAWAGKYIFLAVVWRTYHPGHPCQIMPILLGEQGIGKSSFLANILPPDLEMFTAANIVGVDERVRGTLMSGKVLFEIDEMEGFYKRDIATLKSLIGQCEDHFLPPYGRAAIQVPRRGVFIGTTNDSECLPHDVTGNRRYVVVRMRLKYCQPSSVMNEIQFLRPQWWAEALHLYEQGESTDLPQWLIDAMIANSNAHERRDTITEDIISNWDLDLGISHPKFGVTEIQRGELGYSIAEIQSRLFWGTTDRNIEKTIARALRGLGWISKNIRIGNYGVKKRWFPPFRGL